MTATGQVSRPPSGRNPWPLTVPEVRPAVGYQGRRVRTPRGVHQRPLRRNGRRGGCHQLITPATRCNRLLAPCPRRALLLPATHGPIAGSSGCPPPLAWSTPRGLAGLLTWCDRQQAGLAARGSVRSGCDAFWPLWRMYSECTQHSHKRSPLPNGHCGCLCRSAPYATDTQRQSSLRG